MRENKHLPIGLLMVTWLAVNLIQAVGVGVDGDEAYYWTFSQQLDWGYFDHPPFVALLIRLGEFFGHGPLFTRLGTVVISTLTIPIMFKALPDRLQLAKYFALLFPAVVLFNVYGFIATPDAPLLFFSALFFLGYKHYLKEDNLRSTTLIAIAITGMFYSKYHGILPVLFVTLSNLTLFRKKSFWLIVLLVSTLCLPHLHWQVTNDWPTLRFHLLERGIKAYKIGFTLDYLAGQLLIWGPLVSLLFYRSLLQLKPKDPLMRAHLFSFTGIMLTFFISSFKNHVEAHWTLIAGASFVALFMQILANASEKKKNIFVRTAWINILLIVTIRILFLLPGTPLDRINNYKPFFHGKTWADSLYRLAGNTPVIFLNSYIMPSLYQYYHPNTLSAGYNTKAYRKTQYSLREEESTLIGKKIFWFNDTAANPKPMILSPFKRGDLVPVIQYTPTSKLKIIAEGIPRQVKAGDSIALAIRIVNEGRDTVFNKNLKISYAYSRYSYKVKEGHRKYDLLPNFLAPGSTLRSTIWIIAPYEKGNDRILFSFENEIPGGTIASPYYPIKVE